MAQKDSGDGPSLEMPSLGFGRRKKQPRPEDTDEVRESGATTPPAEPEPAPEPTRGTPLFVEETSTTAARPVATEQRTTEQDAGSTDEAEPEESAAAPRRRLPSLPSLPTIGAMPATLLTGAVVGLLMVVLTWGALHLCEVFRGTSTCGDSGFFLLLAILVVAVLAGSAMLRAFGVPDPGSTSFLGVGLVSVVALLFLGDQLFEWWMVVAIPVVAVAAFALSHWVTTAFVEPSGPELRR
jgi:hypothetical protein